jgi:uncharacterized membrane protein YoaK (UPF0700 family)
MKRREAMRHILARGFIAGLTSGTSLGMLLGTAAYVLTGHVVLLGVGLALGSAYTLLRPRPRHP